MSAIAGIVDLEDRPDRADPLRMLDALAHRGDLVDVWVGSGVALGCREPSHGTRTVASYPLRSADGSIALTADVRLDNRTELASALGRDGVATDGELLLAAYERWGARCVEHLIGDFAFAVWDARERRLVCARDHFGVKSLFVHRSGARIVFGTEIKGIFAVGGVPETLDETAIAYHLSGTFDDTEITLYEAVKRLPAAHVLVVDEGGSSVSRYWALDPERETRLGSDSEYAEAFRELFVDAVRARMAGPARAGAMLSGGLDSSSIACAAMKLSEADGGAPLPTFSAVFDITTSCDEREYIDAVLATGSFEPTYFVADTTSPLAEFDRVCRAQDGVIQAPNLFLNWNLFKPAARQGVGVILDGFDGDTTVSHGTDYFADLARAGHWVRVASELRGFSRNFGESMSSLVATYAWRFGVEPRLSPRVTSVSRRAGAKLRRAAGRTAPPRLKGRDVVSADLARRVALDDRRRALRDGRPVPTNERGWHHWRLTWGVMPYTLELLDRAAAAHGVEVRFPFWDRRLVEFCLSVPAEQKVRGGWTRYILRRGMEGILPKAVQWRGGKSDLSPSFERALRTVERPTLEQILFRDSGQLAEMANVEALRGAFERFVGGRPGESDVVSIWRAVTLALWLEGRVAHTYSIGPQARTATGSFL